jgi:phosphoribosylaminoimidazolecarboxamide formyltransferase / IMP cyclohydrolase
MTRRALLSVYDKTGLEDFAKGLLDLGYELVSSGGTATALAAAGLAHVSVEDVTGFPEMLSGRVKTLHPLIHGGILADRSQPEHLDDLTRSNIAPIDLVACNLYPFTSKPGIEMIDVGGPTMVRAAAKNHAHVGIVVDPGQYPPVLDEMRANNGSLTDATRRSLARAAFAHTAAYDAAITSWFDAADPANVLPASLHLTAERAQVLRYGENPHQQGARYRFAGHTSWWDSAEQLGGKELSYLNVYDTEAAWRLVHDLADAPAVAIIKHANPCGAATSGDIASAYRKAHGCDPVSAFGGVVAVNRAVTVAMAEALSPVFTEVVVAPDFEPGAAEVLTAKKNLRVLRATAPLPAVLDLRSVDGGLLAQQVDDLRADALARKGWKVVTSREPSESEWNDLVFAWVICGHVKSNAIVLATDGQAVGIGAGQQSRVDAAKIAVTKADGRGRGGVCASDAFFPFRDGLDVVAAAGVRAVIQPGGSVRDDEVIAAAEEHGIAMVLTGQRHFRH